MDFNAVCRTCLHDENLNDIFHDQDDHNRYYTALYMTAGIKVEPNDGLPQKMCTSCISHINSSMKFRQQCQEVETKLLNIKTQLETLKENSKIIQTGKGSGKMDLKFYVEVAMKEDSKLDVKTEYTDYEVLEDEDDKPLKYLIEEEADNNEADAEDDPEYVEEKEPLAKEVAKGKNERVTCTLCGEELSVRSLRAHVARRHPGAEPRAACELCHARVRPHCMARHLRRVHAGAARCGYCKTEYDSKEALIEHVASCTAKNKKRKPCESGRELRECDICHKTMQKASLRMHKAVKHAGLGPVCEHCGQRFGNKFRLSEHYRAKHGYQKFQCPSCDFQSAGVMAMRNHERRHKGEKPFVCETCGASFHAAYLLAQHRHKHRTERPVKCDQCPASFKARNSLHTHKRTCHGAARYRCTLCARAYACRHYAVKHLRHVHRHSGPVPPLEPV